MSGITLVTSADKAIEVATQLKDHPMLFCNCSGKRLTSSKPKLLVLNIAISKSCCYIFLVKECSGAFSKDGLIAEILESKVIKKVFHGCAVPSYALFQEYGINLFNAYDIEIAHLITTSGRGFERFNISFESLCFHHGVDYYSAESLPLCTGTYGLKTKYVLDEANKVLPLPLLFTEIKKLHITWMKNLTYHGTEERLNQFRNPDYTKELKSMRINGTVLSYKSSNKDASGLTKSN